MSFWPIVLRALISLSLILNGSAYAVASTHMQLGHMSTGTSVPLSPTQAVATAEPSCGPHQTHAAATPGPLPDATHDQAPAKPQHPSPDCCKSGSCINACTQQAQTAVDMPVLQAAVGTPVSNVSPLKPGHAAPTLPHLIRPPIG